MEKVVIRRGATLSDLEGMLRAEREAWPEEQAFTREHFLSHLEVFPDGIFIAEVCGETAGVGVSEIIRYDSDHPITTWYEVSDGGYIRNSHDTNGNFLYGVSLSVSPRFSQYHLGEKMLNVAKEFIEENNLEGFAIGSRIPRYYKWVEKMPVLDYINQKKGRHYLDPEIDFYVRCGFHVISLLPGYFEDPESLDNGVLMVWQPSFKGSL